MFLMLYDGATNLVTAEVVQDEEGPTTMSLMTEYFEKYPHNAGMSWSVDPSKIGSTGCRQGAWVKGKVVSELGGSMVGVDLGTFTVRVYVRNYAGPYNRC